MKFWRTQRRLRFQTKVLLPVIVVMLMLVLVTLWVVNDRITRQLQTDAADNLMTADAVFRNSQKIREKNLLLRYANVPTEPRFQAASALKDPKTMRKQLAELAAQLGADVIQFTMANRQTLASANRDDQLSEEEFATNTIAAVSRGLNGQAVVDTVTVHDRLFDVVAIPVTLDADIVGVLTVGMECGDAVANELHQLTRSEVVFIAHNHVTATTLPKVGWQDLCLEVFNAASSAGSPQPIELGGEHYLALSGRFNELGLDHPMGYLLLDSYEPSLAALQRTQRTLLDVGLLGVLISALITWALVSRVTKPLRQLRDSAEAIGRGDFTKRVEIESSDECAELAAAFNRMTQNLASARDQLEQTVETLKSTRAQLTQSEKLSAVGEFVAGVAHELNNPLTTVIGYAELLHQKNTDESQRRQLEMVEREAHRCHRIVQSLLSFARRHKPERKPVNFNGIITSALEILAYQMRTSNVDVRANLAPQLPMVVADAHQIQQVLVNILNNARQAISELQRGGWICVTTEATATMARIIVQDNGPGIPEKNLAKIFDPFFTTKDVGQGTGLGLSLCYGIIQEHGGTINVRSVANEGATFIIELPIAPVDGSGLIDQTISMVKPIDKPLGNGKRVLVVDDEAPIVELIQQVLADEQYAVDTAPDGQTALQRASQRRYDMILCDWKMPGLTGREVFERLVSTNPAAAERFVFMTGDVINERTREFLKQYDRQCLPKPFSLDEFRAAVSEMVK